MMLEALCQNRQPAPPLPLSKDSGIWLSDWGPLVDELRNDSVTQENRAERFHATMASTLLAIADKVREEHGECTIGLSGGVFQNNWLCSQVVELCEQHEFEVYIPRIIPCNDGGLSAGQVMEAAAGFTNQ
jgi:hydrogenase maturation protein HypF